MNCNTTHYRANSSSVPGDPTLIYTVVGGSDAVTHTQKYQLAVIFIGMITAFIILLQKIPCSFTDALELAGHFHKTNAVSFNPDLKERYTVWTGMLAGVFLMLSYFGTDQSQVQRYISGDNLRESRLGLMFNALFKIPMQFGILLLGVMLFVFYLFNPSPVFFNKQAWNKAVEAASHSDRIRMSDSHLQKSFELIDDRQRSAIGVWLRARQKGDKTLEESALAEASLDYQQNVLLRDAAKTYVPANSNDNDYVFITFILDNLPHGLIGLLVVCFFFATLQAKAAELNALASCTTVDFYRYLIRPPDDNNHTPDHAAGAHTTTERHYVRASKAFTIFWGLLAIGIALFFHLAENLIETSNTIGSLFSGVILGVFLIAFFIKFIRGTAAFYAALIAQTAVFIMYFTLPIAYLWYNLIGCVATVAVATLLQLCLPKPPLEGSGFPVETNSTPQETPL